MKLAMDWLEFLCCVYAVADPREGGRGGPPRRYFKTGLPPPPYLYRGSLDPALVSGTCRAS